MTALTIQAHGECYWLGAKHCLSDEFPRLGVGRLKKNTRLSSTPRHSSDTNK